MALRDPRPGLRTIHNGSNAVAKGSVTVPAGGDLTVPDVVAEQLMAQGSGAFKDGPAPESLLASLYPPADEGAAEPVADDASTAAVPEKPAKKAASRK